jgi:hypothetical protein
VRFSVGERVAVANAVYQGTVTGGDLSAPVENPDYPWYRYNTYADGSAF